MADKQTAKKNFWDSVTDLFHDITTLDVQTYITYPGIENDNEITKVELTLPKTGPDANPIKVTASLQAYTQMDMDTDTKVLLPMKKEETNLLVQQSILELHKEHVQFALEARSSMISSILSAGDKVSKLFGGG